MELVKDRGGGHLVNQTRLKLRKQGLKARLGNEIRTNEQAQNNVRKDFT